MRGASAGAPDRRGQSQGSHTSPDHEGSWWGGAWSWTTEHASDISAVAGTAAAVTAFIPGVDVIATPLLIGVAVASGALATEQDVAHGENGHAVQDGAFTILNAVPGAAALKGLSKLDDAAQLLKASSATEAGAGADNVVNSSRLKAQLTGDAIAGGHAFDKHVIAMGEFPGLTTRGQFARTIEGVVTNGDMRPLSGGRSAYWQDGVVVIRNSGAADGGTAFRPTDGYDYFLGLH